MLVLVVTVADSTIPSETLCEPDRGHGGRWAPGVAATAAGSLGVVFGSRRRKLLESGAAAWATVTVLREASASY